MMNPLLDTTRLVEIPEGVELELHLAGPAVRMLAWSIDTVLRGLVEIFFLLAIALPLGELGIGIFFILLFLFEWFYPVFFELYDQGATPGKKIMKIKVVQDSGLSVNGSASLLRNLLRAIDFLPFLYGFGLFSMLICKDFKRIGDLAAGTVVVYRNEPHPASALPNQEESESLALHLSPEEQCTVVYFAQRTQNLSRERAKELANLLSPLTGKTGEEGVQALCQMAKNFLGEHPRGSIETKHV